MFLWIQKYLNFTQGSKPMMVENANWESFWQYTRLNLRYVKTKHFFKIFSMVFIKTKNATYIYLSKFFTLLTTFFINQKLIGWLVLMACQPSKDYFMPGG